MIVHNITATLPGDRPFKYRIDLLEVSAEKCADIVNWIHHTQDFECTLANFSIYLRSEEALTMFLLRWS